MHLGKVIRDHIVKEFLKDLDELREKNDEIIIGLFDLEHKWKELIE